MKREQVRIQKEEINARDRMGQTALILGCQLGNLKIIEELISIGADVNAKAIEASDGYTALHYVSENGNLEILKLLLCHQADVFLTNDFGETPFALAEKYEHQSIAEILQQEVIVFLYIFVLKLSQYQNSQSFV